MQETNNGDHLRHGPLAMPLTPTPLSGPLDCGVVLNSVARSSLFVAWIWQRWTPRHSCGVCRLVAHADLQGFGIDIDRDLLRLAAGSPKDTTFARSLAGKGRANSEHQDFLDKCHRKMQTGARPLPGHRLQTRFRLYRFHHACARSRPVEKLDALAFTELQTLVDGRASDLHIALPDILDPEEGLEIGYYGLGLKSGAKPAHSQLAIEDYVEELRVGHMRENSVMAALSASHEVRVIEDGEGDKKRKRKIYDCFVLEVDDGGSIYVLFGGEWFAVEKAFHASVEAGFRAIVAATPFVSSTSQPTERDFIDELATHRNLLNLDQVKLNPSGVPGANLEPCDILSTHRQLIHLKDGHDSAPISHLWNQGIVSAEAFVGDDKYRREFREAVKRRQRKAKKSGFEKLLPDGRSRPNPSDFIVVFGIMRARYKRSGALGLPFFSKISLRATVERIRLMGFKVEVHLVEKLDADNQANDVAKVA